jgi:hypothetical protein
MTTFEELFLAMLLKKPNVNEAPPVANRTAAIYGVQIFFLV